MRTGLLAFLAAAVLTAAAAAQYADGAPRISQTEFKKLIAAGTVVTVDTRNADVYRIAHIPGAVLLPLEGLQDFPPQYSNVVADLKAAKKPIVTYCA